MSKISSTLGMIAVAVAMAGFAGQASAGPNCNTGGARYGAPKAAAAKSAPAPRQALAAKPGKPAGPQLAEAPSTAQGGGESEAKVPALKKASVEPKIEAPQQQAAAPAPQVEASGDYTSVAGIAARLAALAAQQKGKLAVE